MQCPECDFPLLTLELDNVEIDYCSKCAGIWLDSGELEMLTESSSGQTHLHEKVLNAESIGEVDLKCPICLKRMQKVGYGDNAEVVLDKCKYGDGYWLNKGELESVLNMSEGTDKVLAVLKDIFYYDKES